MTGLPDIVIIVDQQEEYTTLRECITLEIPTICLSSASKIPCPWRWCWWTKGLLIF
ncbi:hypothetical protein AAZX31_14G016300 [Glycine max]